MSTVNGREVIVLGTWLKIATLKDEEWLEGQSVADPVQFTAALRRTDLHADIFAYSGPIDVEAVVGGAKEEKDNAAVIRTSDYKAWWEALPQEARKNTRRAAKKGIEIRLVTFDDELVKGIKAIYDEAPVRQGRQFWHFGKNLDTVRNENATYLDRCDFLGAYFEGQLVGFMKIVYVGNVARIMQILCMNAHQDKRPMIALISKAAEVCHEKEMKYLIYGKFTYGRKADSSITEFKRRLGFEQKNFPRYYIPLTWLGRISLRFGVHAGLKGILPAWLIDKLLKIRARWLQKVGDGLEQITSVSDHDSDEMDKVGSKAVPARIKTR